MQFHPTLTERFRNLTFTRSFSAQLRSYLPTQRWFTAKGKTIDRCQVTHRLPIGEAGSILVVDVHFGDGSKETYQMPLAQLTRTEDQLRYAREQESMIIMRLPGGAYLVDAIPLPAFRSELYRMIHAEEQTEEGLRCDAGRALHTAPATAPSVVPGYRHEQYRHYLCGPVFL